jgi:hypothetical protein
MTSSIWAEVNTPLNEGMMGENPRPGGSVTRSARRLTDRFAAMHVQLLRKILARGETPDAYGQEEYRCRRRRRRATNERHPCVRENWVFHNG